MKGVMRGLDKNFGPMLFLKEGIRPTIFPKDGELHLNPLLLAA